MDTVLNKDIMIQKKPRGTPCNPLRECLFHDDGNCCSKIFLIINNKRITDELHEKGMGICLLKFESEEQLYSDLIIKNVLT